MFILSTVCLLPLQCKLLPVFIERINDRQMILSKHRDRMLTSSGDWRWNYCLSGVPGRLPRHISETSNNTVILYVRSDLTRSFVGILF